MSASFKRSLKSPYHEELGPVTMYRVAAWCILFTIRIASVFNRVIHSVLEWMFGFVDTVLQVYLSSSDSDVRFPVSSRQGNHDLTRKGVETNSKDIVSSAVLMKDQTTGGIIRKKSKAAKGNFIHKSQEKDSIIAVSVHAKTTDQCSIPKPNMPETTEPVLNKNNVMETLGEGHMKTQDIEETNMSSTSFESAETSETNIKKLEDIDKGSNEVRNNFATIMEKESALERKKCEEQFYSNGDACVTDSDKHCPKSTTPHGNSSDESNSATPKKPEATNKEGEISKKISPIQINGSLKVPKDIQMEKTDTKASQTPELSESGETITSSEIKQAVEKTLTVRSAKYKSSKTLKPLQSISEEMLKKDQNDAANENREINNEKDMSKRITQKTDIKESTVASSKTVVTCAKDQDKLSENGHNSAFSVKSKVENETGGKNKTEQLIVNFLNSYDCHNYEDYIKLLEDTDQYNDEVRNKYETAQKMEEQCAQKLNKFREQHFSDYEDTETNGAVMEYVNSRIKDKIKHPCEPTCTAPHDDLTELKSNKNQKEVQSKGKSKKNKKKSKFLQTGSK